MKTSKILTKLNPFKLVSASLLTLGATVNAYATTDLSMIVTNVNTAVTDMIHIIEAVIMVAGLVLVVTSIMAFKQASQDVQGTGQHHKKGIVHLLLGACLLLAPTVLVILENTLFGTANTVLS